MECRIIEANLENICFKNLLLPLNATVIALSIDPLASRRFLKGVVLEESRRRIKALRLVESGNLAATPTGTQGLRARIKGLPPVVDLSQHPKLQPNSTVFTYFRLGQAILNSLEAKSFGYCNTCRSIQELEDSNSSNLAMQSKLMGQCVSIRAKLSPPSSVSDMFKFVKGTGLEHFVISDIPYPYLPAQEKLAELIESGQFENAYVVVDRIQISKDSLTNLELLREFSANLGLGPLIVYNEKTGKEVGKLEPTTHSIQSCQKCSTGLAPVTPNLIEQFSNIPHEESKHLNIDKFNFGNLFHTQLRSLSKPPYQIREILDLLKSLNLSTLTLGKRFAALTPLERLQVNLANWSLKKPSGLLFVLDALPAPASLETIHSIRVALETLRTFGNTVYLGASSNALQPQDALVLDLNTKGVHPFKPSTRIPESKVPSLARTELGEIACIDADTSEMDKVKEVLSKKFPKHRIKVATSEQPKTSSLSLVAEILEIQQEFIELLCETPLARSLGIKRANFSLRGKTASLCKSCRGVGAISSGCLDAEQCQECGGLGVKRSRLSQLKFKDINLARFLALSIEATKDLFPNLYKIHTPLRNADILGLSYLKLCTPHKFLSFSELARLKLASKLKQTDESVIYVTEDFWQELNSSQSRRILNQLHEALEPQSKILVLSKNRSTWALVEQICSTQENKSQ